MEHGWRGVYCLIGPRDTIRGTSSRHEAAERGAMLAEFKDQEYMFGRLWFTEDGKLRALLVYTYNKPDAFADCRLRSQLLGPPLDFTRDDEQLKEAVLARNGELVVDAAI